MYWLSILAVSLNHWYHLHQPVSFLKGSQHPFSILKSLWGPLCLISRTVFHCYEKKIMLLPKSLLISEEYGFILLYYVKSFSLMNQKITYSCCSWTHWSRANRLSYYSELLSKSLHVQCKGFIYYMKDSVRISN